MDGAARLIGVGVGPGDPDLVTVRAVRVLRAADLVFVPVTTTGETGRAEAIAAAHVEHDRFARLPFAMTGAADYAGPAATVAAALRPGRSVAFATIGDPNVYSTFTDLVTAVRAHVPEVVVETVPGITAMQDLAARSGTVLTVGTETLALLPVTAGVPAYERALATHDTVVAYKGGRALPEVLAALKDAGRLDDAVYGAHLGLADEQRSAARDLPAGPGPYLSTIIAPRRRSWPE